jgi:hypothetical protein
MTLAIHYTEPISMNEIETDAQSIKGSKAHLHIDNKTGLLLLRFSKNTYPEKETFVKTFSTKNKTP